jgi:hypothetical protein
MTTEAGTVSVAEHTDWEEWEAIPVGIADRLFTEGLLLYSEAACLQEPASRQKGGS